MSQIKPMRSPKTRKGGASRKLLLLIILFFITVLAILFFRSPISKIANVNIEGNELVSSTVIGQASGIFVGDHFFRVSSRTIEQRVLNMRMIESVHVSKRFPGSIYIRVNEHPRVAFQFSDSGTIQALLADGSAIDIDLGKLTIDRPVLSGWGEDDPLKEQLCYILSGIPISYLSDISEIMPAPSESYPDKIKLYTRSTFEVQTTIGYLTEKINYLSSYIQNLQANDITTGIITLLETDHHLPFSEENP